MKVFALKFKEEVVRVAMTEYEVTSDYRWERKELVPNLSIVYGTFTEEGIIPQEEIKTNE